MEYVDGQTLRAMLTGEPLPAKKLLKLPTQMADGLAKAHAAGIVHRDLKPENLMVTNDGFVKILDFGLAKLMPEPSEIDPEMATKTKETREGVVLGTVQYMSPEQAAGRPVDYRSDQFSFGSILYEMATGKHAFSRETMTETLAAVMRDEPESVSLSNSHAPAQLGHIISRCLEKEPGQRYDSTRDLARELEGVESASQAASPTASRLPVAGIVGVGLVAILVVMIAALFTGDVRDWIAGGSDAPQIESIAVLPLDNLSGDPEQDYFVDGMTEASIANLAKISALKVISRTSAMRYQGSDKPLPDIARELGVDAVIEGSAMRVGDRVRITAQLIEAATDQHLWAESYERDLTDILALQGEVARTIAEEIQVKLTSLEDAFLASDRPVNPEAHEAYLRGRHFLERATFFRREDFDTVLDYFQKALEKDPNYAPAYAGLADIYRFLGGSGYSPEKEMLPKAREAALKALELDESLAEAHLSLCNIKRSYDWDWVGARRECDRAVELSPGSAEARLRRSFLLSNEGRVDEATAEVERALELDPLNLRISVQAGHCFILQHQYQRAKSEYLSVLELDPRRFLPLYGLATVYILMEEYDEGVMELRKAFSLIGLDDEVALLERSYPEFGLTGAMRRLAEWIVENSVPAPGIAITLPGSTPSPASTMTPSSG